MQIAWCDDLPSSSSHPSIPILNVKHKVFVRSFADAPVLVLVHWLPFGKGRTLPCTAVKCPHCAAQLPAKRVGYLPVLLYSPPSAWEPRLLSLAEGNCFTAWKVGAVYALERNPSGQPPLAVKLQENSASAPMPVLFFNVKHVLAKLWRINDAAVEAVDGTGTNPEANPSSATAATAGTGAAETPAVKFPRIAAGSRKTARRRRKGGAA